jgi:hypothetical protein
MHKQGCLYKENNMALAIAMLLAYVPFALWMYTQAKHDIEQARLEKGKNQ